MFAADITRMHTWSKLNWFVIDDVNLWREAAAFYEAVFIDRR